MVPLPAIAKRLLLTGAPPTPHWSATYNLASGNPDIICEFVSDRYRASGADATLTALVTNPGTISASGMALTTTNVVAAAALLTAIQSASCTIVAETTGATGGENDAIVSMNNSNSYSMLFALSTNALRNNNGSVLLTTSNTATWTGVVRSGIAFSAAGRSLCLMGGTIATDANTIPARTSIELGWRATDINQFGGHLRRLLVWTRRLSDADLQTVTANAAPWA